ncbi:MAG: hypothetical protein R2739_05245 [Chitinophagales bacterium]
MVTDQHNSNVCDSRYDSTDIRCEDMTVECDGQGNISTLQAWLADNGHLVNIYAVEE